MPRSKSMREKLSNYVVASNGCHLWQGAVDKDGYGVIGRTAPDIGKRMGHLKAHRCSYEEYNGPIPEGAHVLQVRHPALHQPELPLPWGPEAERQRQGGAWSRKNRRPFRGT